MEDTHLLLMRYSRLYWLIVVASRVVASIKTGDHRLPWRKLDDRLAVYRQTIHYRELAAG